MDEKARLQDLQDYAIMDTLPEKELDDLVEIASSICDTPISLLSLVDHNRQWFKSKKGINVPSTHRKDAFCQHALNKPQEVLVVDDPLNDLRFQNNPLVTGDPHIRFYAGAPLETPKGNVLGTLCIIDNKPRKISKNQKVALQLLAQKVMNYLDLRKLLMQQSKKIDSNAERLKKLTDLAPATIYQLETNPNGKMTFTFISKGLGKIYKAGDTGQLDDNPEITFDSVHPDDLIAVKKSLKNAFLNQTTWDIVYRIVEKNDNIYWHWANATPEKLEDGKVVLYGTFQDVTNSKEHEQVLEDILFDISHVIRRPISTMLGLISLMEVDKLNIEKIKEYVHYIKEVYGEMDTYTKKLEAIYTGKKVKKKSISLNKTIKRN